MLAAYTVIFAVSFALVIALALWIRQFTSRLELFLPLFLALLLFGIGFSLRMSGAQPAVDFGFFCTEAAGLFLTALFVAALILGQQRYWELH